MDIIGIQKKVLSAEIHDGSKSFDYLIETFSPKLIKSVIDDYYKYTDGDISNRCESLVPIFRKATEEEYPELWI